MFVFSFSPKKISKKLVILFGIIIAVAVIITSIVAARKNNSDTVNYDGGSYSVRAESISEMTGFLEQFGWKVNPNPIDVNTVIIPSEFNDTYESYNEIQKQQGLDLSDYKGEECKKYSFEITNYPDNDNVNATLIVLNGRVIGGDISETVMDGFMRGFIST